MEVVEPARNPVRQDRNDSPLLHPAAGAALSLAATPMKDGPRPVAVVLADGTVRALDAPPRSAQRPFASAGQDQPDPRSHLEMTVGDGHEAALGHVEHGGLDPARAERPHGRFKLDPGAAGAAAIPRTFLGDSRLERSEVHFHARLLHRRGEGQADAPVADPPDLGRDHAPLEEL